MKYLKLIVCAGLAMSLILLMEYLLVGNPTVLLNNEKLGHVIDSLDEETETVDLNELVPFRWDTLYTFPAYTGKEEIAEIIGFESRDIKSNDVSEGMVHLLFVDGTTVAASILEQPESLGYDLDFPDRITYAEEAQFTVEREDGVTVLTLRE